MKQVTIHSAKTNLSKLIEAAMAGEDVIIARGDEPMVRLVPIKKGGFRIGIITADLGEGPDWFDPMDEDELKLWEGGD